MPVSSTAPNESELGLASSDANIERDQGVAIRDALDALDRVEVGELEPTELELEHHPRHRSASGART